jgi:hypothetical protein
VPLLRCSQLVVSPSHFATAAGIMFVSMFKAPETLVF